MEPGLSLGHKTATSMGHASPIAWLAAGNFRCGQQIGSIIRASRIAPRIAWTSASTYTSLLDVGALIEFMKQPLESTATLLRRVADNDEAAREQLFRQFLPKITRWAHGRLPQYARDLSDTQDLVQIAFMRTLDQIGQFDALREGAFLAYLRKIMLNSIRMEIRRVTRRNQYGFEDADHELPDPDASVVSKVIGQDVLEQYEAALMSLSAKAREAVILRVEFGYTFEEIAIATETPSGNSARMLVSRSLVQLAEAMP
jgi:RNA polymerase sigma-70 factor (ECF subfamily)